ncbi:FMN-linked oxidoreductase [Mycena kentingensis (nom. inval.)]|nr:FMN-linked oxidoreductase [Mycena kentingensis (nom. inval.)]
MALFQPIAVGPLKLQHRVVLCPLTRMRADANGTPILPVVKEYYTQRASAPGTLIISESTFIAAKASGFPHMPGIYSPEQIAAWKEIVDSVHAKGSYIFLQLLALGRNASPAILKAIDPSFEILGPSDIPVDPTTTDRPRPMTAAEIDEFVQLYVQAAKNGMEAGFDGVEIHNANGCLLDQFLQDISNKRTDEYGGSIENRSRLTLRVLRAVADVVGEDRVGIRFSPWSPFAGMGMSSPLPTFSHVISEIKSRFPALAYLHLIEPRISAHETVDTTAENASQTNATLRDVWGTERPIICAGGFTRESAMKLAEERPKNQMVAFGRTFIANPDLPRRLKENIPLHPYDRATFYLPGETGPTGYTDQPFAP